MVSLRVQVYPVTAEVALLPVDPNALTQRPDNARGNPSPLIDVRFETPDKGQQRSDVEYIDPILPLPRQSAATQTRRVVHPTEFQTDSDTLPPADIVPPAESEPSPSANTTPLEKRTPPPTIDEAPPSTPPLSQATAPTPDVVTPAPAVKIPAEPNRTTSMPLRTPMQQPRVTTEPTATPPRANVHTRENPTPLRSQPVQQKDVIPQWARSKTKKNSVISQIGRGIVVAGATVAKAAHDVFRPNIRVPSALEYKKGKFKVLVISENTGKRRYVKVRAESAAEAIEIVQEKRLGNYIRG